MEAIKESYRSLENEVREKFAEKLGGHGKGNPLMGEFYVGEDLASSRIDGLYYDEDEEETLILWEGSDTWLNIDDELDIEQQLEILGEID